jgi:hypothetical protein
MVVADDFVSQSRDDVRSTQRTYYDSDFRQGQSLIRARRPFLVKNALTGLAIVAFTASVCMFHNWLEYSIDLLPIKLGKLTTA